MIVVAIVALEAAVIRAVLTGSMFQRIAVTPIALAIHVATYVAIRRRDAVRWFWSGFAGCGLLATLSLAWYSRHHEAFGQGLWEPYFQGVGKLLYRLPDGLVDRIESDWWARAAAVGLYTTIPQLGVSLIGGLLIYAMICTLNKIDERDLD